MKNKFLNVSLIFATLLLFSCSSFQHPPEKRCPKGLKNDFSNIIEKSLKYKSKTGKTTVNEVRYVCVFTAFYTKKTMYDTYGYWDKELFDKKEVHPILMWKDVKLFKDLDKTFNVYVDGKESRVITFASVMVFDSENNDLLRDDSEYKMRLIEHFGNLIKNNDVEKRDFYEKYWTNVDPVNWKRIQEYKKNN